MIALYFTSLFMWLYILKVENKDIEETMLLEGFSEEEGKEALVILIIIGFIPIVNTVILLIKLLRN